MAETTNHPSHLSHHLLYTPIIQEDQSFIEQAIEDIEHILTEEQGREMEEQFSLDVLSLLEKEEQESLEKSIEKSTFHWRTLLGIYKPIASQEPVYEDGTVQYNLEELSDYSSLSPDFFDGQDDYGITFQFYDSLADEVGGFEDISYKLTREVLGNRFAEMTKKLMDDEI